MPQFNLGFLFARWRWLQTDIPDENKRYCHMAVHLLRSSLLFLFFLSARWFLYFVELASCFFFVDERRKPTYYFSRERAPTAGWPFRAQLQNDACRRTYVVARLDSVRRRFTLLYDKLPHLHYCSKTNNQSWILSKILLDAFRYAVRVRKIKIIK